MSGEESLLAYTREGLTDGGRAYVTKHHDAFTEGVLDLSVSLRRYGINAWIELKATDEWPARPETKIWWDHFTEQQALWLRRRPHSWLFVRIGKGKARFHRCHSRTYALFTGATAWRMWEQKGFTQGEFMNEAHKVWFNRVPWDEFVDAIR